MTHGHDVRSISVINGFAISNLSPVAIFSRVINIHFSSPSTHKTQYRGEPP